MSRYTGPTTRLNRRFGQAIFPANKAFERKAYLPGIHGPRLRRKVSTFSIGLIEKQKLRFMFGMSEKQFRLFFSRAKRKKGVTGEVLLQMLEMRLDSVVYSLGLAKTRNAARQFVNHGHICVNGKKVDIPSYICDIDDEITIRDSASSKQLATRSLDECQYRSVPSWLNFSASDFKGVVNRVPVRDEIVKDIDEQLIVEFYSR